MKLLVSVGVTFGGLFAFLMAGGVYIAYKKLKGMLNKKIKINQAPSGEIQRYDATKQDDEVERNSLRDEEIEFDDGLHINHTLGTPNISEDDKKPHKKNV